MTTKSFISLSLAGTLLAFTLNSCQKTENKPTTSSKLVGKWTKVRYATDDNANGKIEDSEQRDVPSGITSVWEFRKNNTGGEFTTNSPDLPFTWQFNGEQSLILVYSTGDTIIHKIALVNSGNLNITYRSRIGLAEYYYNKQK